MVRIAIALAALLPATLWAAAVETPYGIAVGPGADNSDWYLSRDADVIAVLNTTPENPHHFVAGSGAVTTSKPHAGVMWVGLDNTETLFKAKSAPIQVGGTSWVKCSGRFKVVGGAGGSGAAVVPAWKSQLKEKPGHLIIVHQYVGPAAKSAQRNSLDALIVAQGNWFFNSYSEGGGRYKVTVGRGGEVSDYRGIAAFLAAKDITPASIVTVDDLGHGAHVNVGPYLSGFPAGEDENGEMQPDTRMTVQYNGISDLLAGNTASTFTLLGADHSVGDNIVPGEIAAGVGLPVVDANGNPYIGVPSYTAQYQGLLKTDAPVRVDLLHCFTAERGQKVVTMMANPGNPVTTTFPSVRDAFDEALPNNVTVIGYVGLLHYPGSEVPTGDAVSE
ncbi:MAG: hypothetical protein H0W72_04815 [Planctomycetes bacterium]|nr:hypothetical protein [Planctomycetota bacterium]